MTQLLSIRTNIYYTLDEGKYNRQNEIILLVDQAEYRRSSEGKIIRERGVKELRFVCNEDALTALIETLKTCKVIKEDELT